MTDGRVLILTECRPFFGAKLDLRMFWFHVCPVGGGGDTVGGHLYCAVRNAAAVSGTFHLWNAQIGSASPMKL